MEAVGSLVDNSTIGSLRLTARSVNRGQPELEPEAAAGPERRQVAVAAGEAAPERIPRGALRKPGK
jgi:hypothetical protein